MPDCNQEQLDLTGHQLIWNERANQKRKGWGRIDDAYVRAELVSAACVIAAPPDEKCVTSRLPGDIVEWPWGVWPPSFLRDQTRVGQLAIAGALIAAEIDCLRRQQKREAKANANGKAGAR